MSQSGTSVRGSTNKLKAIAHIDGANMFYTQKKLGWLVDWEKLKSYLEGRFQLLELRYYVGVKPGDAGAQNFLDSLTKLGYIPVTKPLKEIRLAPPQQGIVHKANFDVEMSCDILLARHRFDHLVLLSGDSDFAYLLQILKNEGKETTVLCSRSTLGWELKLATKRYTYLEDIKSHVYRKDGGHERATSVTHLTRAIALW
ncbi:MAG TPA: NYN domain-containing protein [Chloroflexia bacterium]|jgi:uncharacterized LabA/DUF88 family protein